jgi:hypothetical protein
MYDLRVVSILSGIECSQLQVKSHILIQTLDVLLKDRHHTIRMSAWRGGTHQLLEYADDVATETNQNSIQEKIKRRLNSGKASCNSVQDLLSLRLFSKNVKF